MSRFVLFNFHQNASLESWTVVNDQVMGGRSMGSLSVNSAGHGLFSGTVSLENNGGFSLVRLECPTTSIEAYTEVVLRLKGDGKRYQFRLKERGTDPHSFVSYFQTSTLWEDIRIPLNSLYPVFRGQKLATPPFSGATLEEIGILIGNKSMEDFALEIDAIFLD